ncbi:hydrogenase maturation protease [Azorhizophilus paspali]|uniref:hydrogenase maturation protease n=1 Tax=Azorhizophilus paspali TaxID=69963 RepID=UPI00363BCC75
MLLALGNPERGDVAAGPAVAARLRGWPPAGVALRLCDGDLLGQIETWRDLEVLVCVDAAAPQGEPERIRRLDPGADGLLRDTSLTSSHGLGLTEALALARTLGLAPPRLVVYALRAAASRSARP